jgi:hypothetical protein
MANQRRIEGFDRYSGRRLGVARLVQPALQIAQDVVAVAPTRLAVSEGRRVRPALASKSLPVSNAWFAVRRRSLRFTRCLASFFCTASKSS